MYSIKTALFFLLMLQLFLASSAYLLQPLRINKAVSNSVYGRRCFDHFQPVIKTQGSVIKSSTDDAVEVIADIPKKLPSLKGIDYIPLATMLATGDFLGADQFTRDVLIKLSGAEENSRNFVYWSEVTKIPSVDLATIERLWLMYSQGKFGYSIQKRVWEVENGNFDNFIRRIGWTKIDNGIERKLRWFGNNEFVYDLKAAPKAHLPLTSALRGTQLLKALLSHPVWDQYDWKNYENIVWEK